MNRRLFFIKPLLVLILLLLFSSGLYAAQEVQVERLVEKRPSAVAVVEEEKKGEWQVSSFYERSDIVQGARYGHWYELTNRIGYTTRNKISGYLSVSKLRRFDRTDYTANLGTYFAYKGYYVHAETGSGWNLNFIYRLQEIIEVSHKIKNNLYWQFGYTYRAYKTNDTYMWYPGLIYYFGDNYISLDYGLSYIQNRGNSQFGVFKSDFAITKFMHWFFGVAVGERLYDIFELSAGKEYGFIFFSGVNLDIYKGTNLKIGYSYGSENPKFVKRSLNASLTFKF